MLALEIFVNNQRVCVAATTPNKVVSTALTWTHRDPDVVRFSVGGIVGGELNNHCEWNVPELNVGDEVSIRIIESKTGDQPDRVYQPADRP